MSFALREAMASVFSSKRFRSRSELRLLAAAVYDPPAMVG